MNSFEIISRAIVTGVETPNDYPMCVCGGTFILSDYANKKGRHQLTAAECISCSESFTIYDVQDGYSAILRGQKARKEANNG